jgi:hypothetical protein
MPFNSESASLGGQKSKRGKSLSQEVKHQLINVAEDLIKAIEITSIVKCVIHICYITYIPIWHCTIFAI